MWLVCICPLLDYFCGGVAVDGIVKFVLDCGEESLSGWRILAVINCRGIDVCDFLVEAPLRKPYLTDFLE